MDLSSQSACFIYCEGRAIHCLSSSKWPPCACMFARQYNGEAEAVNVEKHSYGKSLPHPSSSPFTARQPCPLCLWPSFSSTRHRPAPLWLWGAASSTPGGKESCRGSWSREQCELTSDRPYCVGNMYAGVWQMDLIRVILLNFQHLEKRQKTGTIRSKSIHFDGYITKGSYKNRNQEENSSIRKSIKVS